jgi:transketolase
VRNAFIEELVALASVHPHIALIVGDLGFSVIEPFADQFPDRFINAGVAEQNMTGLAAGMASEGFHVFTYSIANFPTFRCAEQIRNDVDYHKLPVTVVAVGGGLAYGALGYSHHAVQDYALMRSFPNTLIAAPGDPMEVRACLRYLLANPQPSYLRLGKAGEPCFHTSVPSLEPGKWLSIKANESEDCDKTLLTTGATLEYASTLIRETEMYRGYALHTLPLWGMSTKVSQLNAVKNWKEVVTVEDHLQDAGFGSWMCEALIENSELMTRIKIKALNPKICGMVGQQKMLNETGWTN